MKTTGRRITAVMLTFALTLTSVCGVRIQGVTPEVKNAKAAEDKGKYVKDIVISYASSKEKAEKELGSDYIVLDKNFNDGMSGNSWIGYTTTDDAGEAIKDIKAMPMDGKYSTSDYEVLLNNQKGVIELQLDAVIPVIIEYAKNYDAGMETAQVAHRLLNVYIEDDSKKSMGDFLLEKGRALAKNKNDSNAVKDLEKVYMEGNNCIVSSMESLLVRAQDTQLTKKGSWITRMSMLGPDGLYTLYKNTFGGSKTSINKKLDQDFGEVAETLLQAMKTVRDKIREGEQSEIAKADGDQAAINSILSDLSGDDIEEVPYDSNTDEIIDTMYKEAENGADAAAATSELSAYCVSKMLKETPYGKDENLYDFFMNESLSKKDLYTMAYSLSAGQKSILDIMGVYPLFESAFAEYSEKDSEGIEDIELDENMFSVYEGVDRSIFDGDTAITDETLKNMETRQFKDYLTPAELTGRDYIMLTTLSLIMAGIMTGYMIRSFSYETKILFAGSEVFEKNVLKTMQKNLEHMNTYDKAWKLMYMEEKGLTEKSISSIVGTTNPERELNLLYDDVINEVANKGYRYEKTVSNINQFGQTHKNAVIKKYESKIKLQEKMVANADRSVKVKVPRAGWWGTRLACVIGAVAAIAFAGYEIYCLVNHDKINFAHIPSKMVARTYEGDVDYLAYHAVTTESGKASDIHDKKGKGWQVLYTTTNDRMGDPILASSLSVDQANSLADPDKVPVTYFDESYAADLMDEKYTGADIERVCLYFSRGTEPIEEVAEVEETEEPEDMLDSASGSAADVEGSVFGNMTAVWMILIVVVIGIGAGTGVYIRKRKKAE